jgi:cytoskeletal protein CcmA (bactofilin family)
MWNRNNSERDVRTATVPAVPPPPTAPAPARQSHVETAPPAHSVPAGRAIIGKSMRVKGDISGAEDLRIDGELEGTLDLKSKLTIGPSGKVTANIRALEVIVQGIVKGNVEAIDKITIQNGANIIGDVKTAGIVIEDGAYFKGGIDIARPETNKANGKASNAAAT